MTQQINERKRFLDVGGVASYLELSKHTIRSWVKTRQIPFIKYGRAVRFDTEELESWLKNKKVPVLQDRYLNLCLSSFSLINWKRCSSFTDGGIKNENL